MKEKRLGSFNCSDESQNKEQRNMPDYVYACVLMKRAKVEELDKQKKKFKDQAMFIMLGLLSANVKLKVACS